MSAFYLPLNRLVENYRSKPFEFWRSLSERDDQIIDTADTDSKAPDWWQAETSVLEIARMSDGRTYAHVAIFLCPRDIHSNPPGPSAGFLAFEDGTVSGNWADGTEFKIQSSVATMPPNKSLERTREG
jgi:hypothetical protein